MIRSTTGAKTETAAMAQWMIGETFFHQESFEEAVAAYLRVEILYDWPKWQAGALLQAAKCQELLGRYQQAIETYDRLIRTYPDSEFTEEAKHRLRVAQKHRARRRPKDRPKDRGGEWSFDRASERGSAIDRDVATHSPRLRPFADFESAPC